jgi:hypothetical protein
LQRAPLQAGLGPSLQALPQAPQLFGSVCSSTHVAEQHVAPVPHAAPSSVQTSASVPLSLAASSLLSLPASEPASLRTSTALSLPAASVSVAALVPPVEVLAELLVDPFVDAVALLLA